MKISCDVIHDLMPLHKDGLASDATSEIIKEHLLECPKCSAYFDEMDTFTVNKPEKEVAGNDVTMLHKIRKKLRLDKVKGITFATLFISILAILAVNILITPEYLSYEEGVEKLIENEDGSLYLILGENVASYDLNEYDSKGMEKEYSVTSWTTYLHQLLGNGQRQAIVINPNSEEVSRLYYYNAFSTTEADQVIYGQTDSKGGVFTLPRLTLGMYFIMAIVFSIILVFIYALSRKWSLVKVMSVAKYALFCSVSYSIAHLVIKGFDSSSHSLLRDFYMILILATPIFILLLVINKYRVER